MDPFYNVNQTNTVKFLRKQVFKESESKTKLLNGSHEMGLKGNRN